MKSLVIIIILFLSFSVNSFSQITHLGLDGICVNDIRIDNDYLYVGAVDSGVYRFNTLDSTWNCLGLKNKWINSIYTYDDQLVACVDNHLRPGDTTLIYKYSSDIFVPYDTGIYKGSYLGSPELYKLMSIDGWKDSDGTTTLYIGELGQFYQNKTGVWNKTDQGGSFYLRSVHLKTAPNGDIFAGGWDGFGQSTILKKNAQSDTWGIFYGDFCNPMLWNYTRTIGFAFDPTDTNIVYIVNGGNIIKFTRYSGECDADGFVCLGRDHMMRTITIDPLDKNHLFAGGDHFQLYETTDAGLTWNLITAVDSNNHITDIEIPPTEISKMYISTSKNGVYQLPLPNAHTRMKIYYGSGWSLISLPLKPLTNIEQYSSPQIPKPFFYYSAGYNVIDTIRQGVGYWNKIDKGGWFYFVGDEILSADINVEAGWNMIGSISKPVAVADLVLSSGLTIGPVIKYTGSFQTATTIDPGLGYWVRANQAGTITLVASP